MKRNLFDCIFIPIMLASLISSAILFKSSILIPILTILGILGSILNGKGSALCYCFALTSSVIYAIISLRNNFYGEFILHTCFLLPVYIFSIIKWFNPKNRQKTSIRPMYKLNIEKIVFYTFISGILIGIYGVILKYLIKSALPFLNAASTVILILANFLGAKRVREQWIVHTIGDFVLIALWLLSNDMGNYPILIENILFIVTNIRGLIIWNRQINQKPIEPPIEL